MPLPDRLRLHEMISPCGRRRALRPPVLLEIIADVPLAYGPWRALKRIFKEAEARGDTEVYGRPGRPLRHAPSPAGTGRQVSRADARLPVPAGRGGTCGASAVTPARVATPTSRPTCWPTTPTTRTGAAPGSPTTSSTTRRKQYGRSRFHLSTARPARPAQAPGLRRAVAAQPAAAVLAAGAGAGRPGPRVRRRAR